MATPTNEPRSARAGDTWAWRREDLTDYPPGTWTLRYFFKAPSANFSFDATADGTAFAIARTAAQTAVYTAGVYQWFAFVTDGTARHQVDEGTLEVLPDMGVAGNLDTRSTARKILEYLDAALVTAAQSNALMSSYSINGRSVTFRTVAELQQARDYWAARVRDEDAAQSLAAGAAFGHKLAVRLG